MNPDIEDFLNAAFQNVQPTSPAIGRVVIEPDYEADVTRSDAEGLPRELLACLQTQSPDSSALAAPEGVDVKIPAAFPLLAKYVREITLHQNKLDGSWVEVAPPGSWI
jgi:hypothetical protein